LIEKSIEIFRLIPEKCGVETGEFLRRFVTYEYELVIQI